MKAIRVIENNWSKILCHMFNIFAITFYHYILLGCYCEYNYSKEEVLLNQLPHYYQFRTNKWYIFEYLKKLILRKDKLWLYNIEPVTSEILHYTHIKGEINERN